MQEVYRVADYIADFIVAQGVGHVFLLPGGGAMHLVDGVGRNERLQVVPCSHEQGASISAEAYARVNENIGVAMVTSGPGATNAITAVAGAWIESVPLVVISGQVKRADMMLGMPVRQKGVQEVDIVTMVRSITKYAITVQRPEDIRAVLEEAFHSAREGRQGPVWIDVPLDVQGSPMEGINLEPWNGPKAEQSTGESPDHFDQLRSLIEKSVRPLILAGHGIRLSGAARRFREVVEKLGIPVVTTWNSLDLLPYDHDLNIGRPGVVALRTANFAVQNCDLLISIGSRLDNVITAFNPRGFARAAKKVVVDIDRNEIDKLDMAIDLKVVSDAGTFIAGLGALKTIDHRPWQAWKQRCLDWKQRFGVRNEKTFASSGEITHYQFIDALSDVVESGSIVSSGSSGLGVEVFYSVFRNKEGQRVFLTSGLGSMGYGLPSAIGACFANGCKPMVAVETDGSLQLNIQEFATMRSFGLPICLFVMNNSGYASIRNTMRNYFKGRYVGTGPEAGLFLPDLEKVAATYELGYAKVDDAGSLHEQLAAILAQQRPMIVDVRLVKNESLEPKVSAIPQQDGSMISMPMEDMSPLLPLELLEKEMIVPLSAESRKVTLR
ncbi:MAG: thiamine pyrophosphate-binding protein [Chlorobiaceae bacterium]|nr:thiamine pyrophosphate-binding protein [Chlorobiaceae bacterium]